MAALIRPATPADIPPMVELLRELFSIEVDFTPEPSKQRSGLELLLRPTYCKDQRPSKSRVSRGLTNCQAPMFSGSSCTQTISSRLG